MRRGGRAIRLVIRRQLLAAIRDNQIIDRAIEQCQTGQRLVERHLVAGLVDPQEGEVAVLAHLAVFDAVDGERGVA